MMRFFTFLLSLVFSCSAFAQQSKINFDLQAAIKKYSPNNQVITLFVKGNVGEIKNYLEQNNATYGLSARGFIQVKMPVNTIEAFAKNNFVEYIEYTIPNIQLLNDTMLINNNVVDAHSGVAPLRQTYTGKGVLFGLIDTTQVEEKWVQLQGSVVLPVIIPSFQAIIGAYFGASIAGK